MKQCNTCRLNKSLDEFSKSKTYLGGYRHICKSCSSLKTSEYYSKRNKRKIITAYSHNNISNEERKLLSRLKNLCTKARNRKREVTIDVDYLKKIYDTQQGLCKYSGLPLSIESNHSNTISLDRIDSSKDYIVGNVQLVCSTVNRMKQEFPEKEFLEFCTLIAQNTMKDTLTIRPL